MNNVKLNKHFYFAIIFFYYLRARINHGKSTVKQQRIESVAENQNNGAAMRLKAMPSHSQLTFSFGLPHY